MVSPGQIFLLLGSNLGDRLLILKSAREQIAEKVGAILKESSIYETAPWGLTDQPAFLNQVIEVDTEFSPQEVLPLILDIEHELGRVRYERWGARVIDIDLLYYKNSVLSSALLTIPHPRIQDRRFTLIPLSEIAPDFLHPLLQKTSLEMLSGSDDNSEVIKFS